MIAHSESGEPHFLPVWRGGPSCSGTRPGTGGKCDVYDNFRLPSIFFTFYLSHLIVPVSLDNNCLGTAGLFASLAGITYKGDFIIFIQTLRIYCLVFTHSRYLPTYLPHYRSLCFTKLWLLKAIVTLSSKILVTYYNVLGAYTYYFRAVSLYLDRQLLQTKNNSIVTRGWKLNGIGKPFLCSIFAPTVTI